MNTTDAEIAKRLDGIDITGIGIRRESQNNSWMVLYPTHDEGSGRCLLTTATDLLAFCRAAVERMNGGTSLYHDFFIAWNRCESNRGCYSCCESHDCRCEKERGISKVCTCGRDELEAIETKIDEQEGAI